MGRMGVLRPDERVELIEGEIIVMSPAGIRHSSCVLRLNEAFNTERLAGRALVHVQNSMAASNLSEPEPDVMLLAYREDRYASRHPQPDDMRDIHAELDVLNAESVRLAATIKRNFEALGL